MTADSEPFAPTRASLIARLKNVEDQDGWREFFETYWRLIYSVARRSGLDDNEAQDIVQETVASVARKIAGFRPDPALGTFKSWLMLITRSRIADHLRKKHRRPELVSMPGSGDTTTFLSATPNSGPAPLEVLWEEEWEQHILQSALRTLKTRLSILHYQIFDLATFQGQAPAKIARSLGVTIARVYLVKHRVSRLLRTELVRVQEGLARGATGSDRPSRP